LELFNVLKWLVILLVVLTTFSVLLLGLGYMLKTNEKKTIAFMNQQEPNTLQATANKNRDISGSLRKKEQALAPNPSTIRPILAKNLTCSFDDQCVLVNAAFADLTCTVAINTIGAAQLLKAKKDDTEIGRCLKINNAASAVCQNNICSISPSN